MRFRLITDEEAGRFDGFMQSTPNGHILQSYSWGEVKRPDWEPLRVVVEEEGNIVAAASILKRKIPFTNRSFFYLPRGPVLQDWKDLCVLTEFISHLRRLARAHRAVFVKIDPSLDEDEAPVDALKKMGFIHSRGRYEFGGLQPRYTFRLDISKELDEIMEDFPKNIRYKIKYGCNKGLKFVSPGEKGLEQFVAVMKETGHRGDFVIRNAAYYQKLFQVLGNRGEINLTLGYYDEQAIAAGITVAFGNKAWALYGGQVNRFRNLYAYHAMIWERIKWAKSKGASWFDFYGVPGQVDEKHPLYGIYYFKKSFGGRYCAFIGEKDLIISPFYYKIWSYIFPLVRSSAIRVLKPVKRLAG